MRRALLWLGYLLCGIGIAAILASGRAPAYAQGTTVHWVRWSDFVPTSDQLLKGKITQECQKALGMKLNLETINANDIQARVTSSIQSGTGPDIFMAIGNWPQLYADSLADAGDVAEEIGKAQGGYYDISRQVATVMGRLLGQTIIVENKAGGGGNIGTTAIARAAPDGYTIGIGNFAPLSVNKALMGKMSFDPVTDLVPVVLLEKGPIVLLVNEKSPYKTLKDLMADAKTINPSLEYLLVSRNLERVADLATNIGEDAVFLAEGKNIKHGGGIPEAP